MRVVQCGFCLCVYVCVVLLPGMALGRWTWFRSASSWICWFVWRRACHPRRSAELAVVAALPCHSSGACSTTSTKVAACTACSPCVATSTRRNACAGTSCWQCSVCGGWKDVPCCGVSDSHVVCSSSFVQRVRCSTCYTHPRNCVGSSCSPITASVLVIDC